MLDNEVNWYGTPIHRLLPADDHHVITRDSQDITPQPTTHIRMFERGTQIQNLNGAWTKWCLVNLSTELLDGDMKWFGIRPSVAHLTDVPPFHCPDLHGTHSRGATHFS